MKYKENTLYMQGFASIWRIMGVMTELRYLVPIWSTWKKCSSCPYSEDCFIPMFPLGAIGDRENPQCRNATGLWRFGYWRGMQPQ